MHPRSRKLKEPKAGSLRYAAAKLGCSLPTLYELIAAGKLRTYHLGRAHRVTEMAIRDCIAVLERESRPHRAAIARRRSKQAEEE